MFFGKTDGFIGFDIANIENKMNKSNIAISIWTVIVLAVKLLSTTIFPSQAWNKIAISDKKDKRATLFLLLKNFNEYRNKTSTDNPAIAPINRLIYSIQVW